MNFHFHPRRDQFKLARLVLTDACFLHSAARTDFLTFGQIVLDVDVRKVVNSCPSRGCCLSGLLRHWFVFNRWHYRLCLVNELGDLKEMTLARGIDEAFTPPPKDVAAHQGQYLGQLCMLFLKLVIVGRCLIEYPLQLFHSSLGVLGLLLGIVGLLLGTLGLLPQLVIAAEQVFEQPLALAWIIGSS